MDMIELTKKFTISGKKNFDGKDFSYHLFENLSLKEMDSLSFFRCDFRGARFKNVAFNRNNFDRADFISCIFEECTFIEVNIGASEIKNCIFKNIKFINNQYDNTSIQECSFTECAFEKEHLLVNLKNTHFLQTSFTDISFERSTTERDTFEKCFLLNVDFATMHAECHRFINCELDNVALGISYVFGYLLYETNITAFKVLYHGKEVSLDNETEAKKRLRRNRLYESLNILFIYKQFEKIPTFFSNIVIRLINNYDVQAHLELVNIFDAIIFYASHKVIPYDILLDIYSIISDMDFSALPFSGELEMVGLKEKFLFLTHKLVMDDDYIQNWSHEYALLYMHINTDNLKQAIAISENFFNRTSAMLDKPIKHELYDIKQGSIILIYIISVATLFIIPKIIKEYSDLIFSLEFKHTYVKQVISKLKQKRITTEKIAEIMDAYEKAGIDPGNDIDIVGLISEVKACL